MRSSRERREGFGAGYRAGREEAAEAVAALAVDEDDWENNPTLRKAYAAARGPLRG